MIYLLVLCILFVGTLLDKEKGSKNAKIWWIIEWLTLVLLAGLRYRMGSDSLGYDDMHKGMETFSDLARLKDWTELKYMPLWHLFVASCLSITDDFVFLQIIEAIIVNSVIFWFVKKYARRPFMVVLFYFILMYPYYNTEILRQVLTVCCFLLSIPSLIKGKYLRYYIWAIVGFGFHQAGVFLFVFPLIYVYMKSLGNKSMFSFLFIFIVGLIFISQMESVSMLMKIVGMKQVGVSMTHTNVNYISFFGIIYRLLTEWSLTCVFLLLCKEQEKTEKVFLSIYIFIAGISIPIYLMLRIVDFLWIPYYVVILNNLDRFVLSKDSKFRVGVNRALYGFLAILIVFNVIFIRFKYYTMDREVVTNKKGTYMYNMYIPYNSVFDPEKDEVREDLHYNGAIEF